MAITTLAVIEAALRDINVIGSVDSAAPEQGTYGVQRLNQMMAVWKEDSIDVGYFSLEDTNGDCPIPEYAELAVISGLAIAMAGRYGATLSQENIAVADTSITTLKRKLISESLTNTDMTHLPRGTGKYWYGYDITNDT